MVGEKGCADKILKMAYLDEMRVSMMEMKCEEVEEEGLVDVAVYGI